MARSGRGTSCSSLYLLRKSRGLGPRILQRSSNQKTSAGDLRQSCSMLSAHACADISGMCRNEIFHRASPTVSQEIPMRRPLPRLATKCGSGELVVGRPKKRQGAPRLPTRWSAKIPIAPPSRTKPVIRWVDVFFAKSLSPLRFLRRSTTALIKELLRGR